METAIVPLPRATLVVSYSLGDAIDWKPSLGFTIGNTAILSYSLGDAIDWKLSFLDPFSLTKVNGLLLARGRD